MTIPDNSKSIPNKPHNPYWFSTLGTPESYLFNQGGMGVVSGTSRELIIDNLPQQKFVWIKQQTLNPYGEYYPRAVNDNVDKYVVYNSGSYLTH
jgi:hypothetical protein